MKSPESVKSKSNVTLDAGLTLDLGDHSYIHGGKITNPSGALTHLAIGKFCSIATDVTVIGYDHHSEWITMFPFLDDGHRANWPGTEGIPYPQASQFGSNKSRGDITIGHDVWIGYGVKLFKGVTIGNGAVIGACSLVNKSVEPYTVVAGIPARPIRKRFSDEEIAILEKVQWWNLPAELINRYLPQLCSANIAGLEQQLAQDPDYQSFQNKLRAEEYLAQADAAFARSDLAAASLALQQAVTHDPTAAPLHVCLGNLQFQLSYFDGALQSFTRAAELQPDDSDVLARLASAARACNEPALFEKNLNRALELNPKNPLALRLAANLNLQQHRHAEAAAQYFTLLGAGVEDVELLLSLGECLNKLRDLNSARWCYERALAADPTSEAAQEALRQLKGKPAAASKRVQPELCDAAAVN